MFENIVLQKNTLFLISWSIIGFGLLSFLLLQKQKAPYGRYAPQASSKWGPGIPARFAWMIQEIPSFLWALYFLIVHPPQSLAALILLLCFLVHYAQRTFHFSLRIRGGKATKLVPFILAFIFCFINGYLQCCFLSYYFVSDTNNYVMLFFFLIGVFLFIAGMAINIHADHILRNLRRGDERSHKIPHGGFFKHVSAANFFGEIVEWAGFAIASGFSLPSCAFAFSTFANIGPRGKQHHEDYLKRFADYPKSRKAVIPYFW